MNDTTGRVTFQLAIVSLHCATWQGSPLRKENGRTKRPSGHVCILFAETSEPPRSLRHGLPFSVLAKRLGRFTTVWGDVRGEYLALSIGAFHASVQFRPDLMADGERRAGSERDEWDRDERR